MVVAFVIVMIVAFVIVMVVAFVIAMVVVIVVIFTREQMVEIIGPRLQSFC